MKYLYVSHHKCATQYTIRVIRQICRYARISCVNIDARHTQHGLPRDCVAKSDFVMLSDYTHGLIEPDRLEIRGFHVIRDPRDVLLSTYHSHKTSHRLNEREIKRDRRAFKKLDVAEGIGHIMNDSSFFLRYIESLTHWNFGLAHMYETTFTKVTQSPETEFTKILDHLEIAVDERALSRVLKKNSFEELRKRWARRHPWTRVNHYRTGQSGEWRDYITGTLKDAFKERYGELLIRLGYEQDTNW